MRDEKSHFVPWAIKCRGSTGQQPSSELYQSKDHGPSQPEGLGDQRQPAAQSSDPLAGHTTPNDPCQSAIDAAPKLSSSSSPRHVVVPAASSPGISWQDDNKLVMPELNLSKSSPRSAAPAEFVYSQGPRKWISTEDYLKSIRPLQTVPAERFEPEIFDVEDALPCSDLESQQSKHSHLSKSSTPLPDTTAHNGMGEISLGSTLVELCTILNELKDLLVFNKELMMKNHMESLLRITRGQTRNTVLNEVSKALRDRAATKSTMGRSERLILEREANFICRMTSAWPGNPAEQQHVKILQNEHEETWLALLNKVDMLFHKALTTAEKAHSRLS